MKQFFTIILFLFCISFLQGQKNLQKYYQFINKAELAICDLKYEKASELYEKAFKEHTPFINDLFIATNINVKFTKKYNLSLNYAQILLQRDFEIGWIYRDIAPNDSLIAKQFKILEDTVRSLTNKNLKIIFEEMLVEDQKKANTPQEMYDKSEVYHTNFVKLFDLFNEYGSITEQKIGIYEYSPIHIILIHCAQNQMSPQELLLIHLLNGDVYVKNYMKYYDLYLEYINKPTIYYYGWRNLFIANDVLFINYPEDIEKFNEERQKINMSETWEDYLKKVKYQFLHKNFQFYNIVKTSYEETELQKIIQEIDQEHQKGIYKREYIRREK